MLKRLMGIIMIIMILAGAAGPTAAEENEDEVKGLYKQYMNSIADGELVKVVPFISNDFVENTESVAAKYGLRQDIYKLWPDFAVLETIDVSEVEERRIEIDGTELYVNSSEISGFDTVLICKRECDFWDLIEFIGIIEEEGISKIGYVSTLVYNVTLESGRKVSAADVYEITKNVIAKGYEAVGCLYGFQLQTQLNDIITSKYLHINKEAEMKEYLEKEKPAEFVETDEEKVVFRTSLGEARIQWLQVHMYAREVLTMELYYLTKGTTDYYEQLHEIYDMTEQNLPGCKECFPSILYIGLEEETNRTCYSAYVVNHSYDESILFDSQID